MHLIGFTLYNCYMINIMHFILFYSIALKRNSYYYCYAF